MVEKRFLKASCKDISLTRRAVMRFIPSFALFLFFAAGCATAPATAAAAGAVTSDSIQVMVLGTWHFEGSTSDLVSAKPDSVLTPERQRELEDVAARLAAFKPTAIVTERMTSPPDYADPKFAEFSPEMLANVENERVQIAYRLAHRAGVSRVYGLDEQPSEGEPDYFPFDKVLAHAEATGRRNDVEKLIADARALIEERAARLSTMTIAEGLIDANQGELSSPAFYYALLDLDEGEAQPGAELNAYWFMRNAKIFSKLIDVTKPGDRVIVVFGAGHKFWLDHLTEQTPGFVKIDPNSYLQARPQR